MTHNLIKQFPNFTKFIFFSTANLYSPSRKVTENSKITVQSPYAESKLMNEKSYTIYLKAMIIVLQFLDYLMLLVVIFLITLNIN